MSFDHLQRALRGSLAFGYRPSYKLIEKRILRRMKTPKYVQNTDEIPFLCSHPDMQTEPLTLDFSHGGFTLMVSPPGAGKTFALRGLVGELVKLGYKVVDLCSIKNNFLYGQFPLQEKFHKWLPPWREPKALPVVPFEPLYLFQKQKKRLKDCSLGQISLKDIESIDLIKSTLSLDEFEPKAQLIKYVWDDKHPPKNIDDLMKKLQNASKKKQGLEMNLFQKRTIGTLMRDIWDIRKENLFGETNNMDFVEVLNKGYFPCLCFNYDRSLKRYHQTYIATLARQIYMAKVKAKLKGKIAFIWDDMGTLACPSRENPSCKDVIVNDLISLGREKGIYNIGTTQNLNQIPEDIVRQVKHFIFFGQISGQDLKIIADTRNVRMSWLREKLKSHQPVVYADGRRSCTVWSTGEGSGIKGKAFTGFVPAPSSYHHEQD